MHSTLYFWVSAAIVSNLLPHNSSKSRDLKKCPRKRSLFNWKLCFHQRLCFIKTSALFLAKGYNRSKCRLLQALCSPQQLAATCNKPDFIMRAQKKVHTVSSALYMACANYMPRYISVVLQQNNPAFWSCAIFPLRISHDCCLAASHPQL